MSADWNSTKDLSTCRDPLGQGEPLGDQLLLDRLDERRQVDADGVVLDRDRAATLAGQGLDQRLVGHPVGLDPGVLERLALDDPLDLGADKALHAVGDRAGQPLQRRGGLGGQPAALHAGAQRVHDLGGERLDVDVGEDLGGDLVGDGLLDRGIRGQRRDRGDVPVGVGDLVAGPHRHPGERCQHAAEHDQQDRHDGPPPLAPAGPGGPWAGRLLPGRAGPRSRPGAGSAPPARSRSIRVPPASVSRSLSLGRQLMGNVVIQAIVPSRMAHPSTPAGARALLNAIACSPCQRLAW